MSYARIIVAEHASLTSKLNSGSNKPRRATKGKSSQTAKAAAKARAKTSSSSRTASNNASGSPSVNEPLHSLAAEQSAALACANNAVDPLAMWPNWPAAGINRQGLVHATNAKVLQTLKPVMLQKAGQPMQLTESANRQLWSLVTQNQSKELWKVLDPVFWPFIGIVGWSEQSKDMLQLAAWESAQTPWQIDDSWRQILTATAAVKAKRKRRVA